MKQCSDQQIKGTAIKRDRKKEGHTEKLGKSHCSINHNMEQGEGNGYKAKDLQGLRLIRKRQK